jgi:ATPase family associated with various cellular activities (AAA)/Winged helix domain, variant
MNIASHLLSSDTTVTSQNPAALGAINSAFFDALRNHLQHHLDTLEHNPGKNRPSRASASTATFEQCSAGPQVDYFCHAFDLSRFECNIVLLCAGAQLDSHIATLCGQLMGSNQRQLPTFALAMSLFKDSYWQAITPAAPIRYWQIVTLQEERFLLDSPLLLDESILHYLSGENQLDARLLNRLASLPGVNEVNTHAPLPNSLHSALEQMENTWIATFHEQQPLPLLQLIGSEQNTKCILAARLARNIHHQVYYMSLHDVLSNEADKLHFTHLWNREARLKPLILFVDINDGIEDPVKLQEWLNCLSSHIDGPLIISAEHKCPLGRAASVTIEVKKATRKEQADTWLDALTHYQSAPAALTLEKESLMEIIRPLVMHFNLDTDNIRTICRLAYRSLENAVENGNGTDSQHSVSAETLNNVLWQQCRQQNQPALDDLAQRVEAKATFDTLILPPAELRALKSICVHGRLRSQVYDTWNFSHTRSRGIGISVLFSGPSGTGKTTAAEVIANALNLDLYRVELSNVVSKYIGETEKQLKRIFDAAESCGAILLFDEADALFGKRSEVKDSRDRYANQEVSYLLQRMETFSGLAILTTNLKDSIDKAFIRRLRYIVDFDMPDESQRRRIWSTVFPKTAPTRDLDYGVLSRLNISGGHVHNIALAAAFLAAHENSPITMNHIGVATIEEYEKTQRHLTAFECQGWLDPSQLRQ